MRHFPLENCNRPHARPGGAMLLVMGALTVAFILGMIFLASSTTSSGAAKRIEDHARARQIAESGLDITLDYLRRTPDWRDHRQPGNWAELKSMHGGSLTVHAQFTEHSDDPVAITTTAHYGTGSAMLTANLLVERNVGGQASLGVVIGQDLELIGNARIDGFDSRIGAYGASNRTSDAVITMMAGTVLLNGSSTLLGDLVLGPAVNPDTDVITTGTASVTGRVSRIGAVMDAALADPAIEAPLTNPGLSHWGTEHIGTPGQTTFYRWDELLTRGSLQLIVQGPVVALVEGDVRFTAGSRIDIQPDASLTLYGNGRFELSGNAEVNMNSADPTRFTYYGLTAQPISVMGSGRTYGRIIAPLSDLRISGAAGRVHGVVHVASATLQGSGSIHQDVNPDVLDFLQGGYVGVQQHDGGEAGTSTVKVLGRSDR